MKINNIICAAVIALALTACGDFSFQEYLTYDEEYAKLNFSNVGGILTPIYTSLDTDFGNYSGAMLASACDEAEYAYESNAINYFYNGAWGPSNAQSSMWTTCYGAIQICNMFLTDFVGLTFDDLALNSDYNIQMQRYNNYPYEVRGLRAYFYFNLVRQYGAVPMPVPEEWRDADASNSLSRVPAQEVFDYIISECEAIQDLIQDDYTKVAITPSEIGRFSRMAVLALKARAALYAASPLFNTDNDASLWTRAAQATAELIADAEGSGKELISDYSDLWSADNYTTASILKELIYWRSASSETGNPEIYNYPVGVTSGSGGNCPTQNLVDAYDMVETGEPYDGGWGPDDDPYTGRDPRFAMTIAYNGEIGWPSWRTTALENYYGGIDGEPNTGATPTGYYLKKLLHGSTTFESGESNTSSFHHWITYRLAEFYLNYAECIYKVTGSPYIAYNGHTANEMVNKTRIRAGMPEIPSNLTNDEWWEKYERERMVELAFEGHRFWDLRRWKEGKKCLENIYEVKITNAPEDSLVVEADTTYTVTINHYTYTKNKIDRGAWDDKMYLFPIPTDQIQRNPNLEQNPGW